MTFILASQSPRRKELLQRILPEFKIVPAEIDEKVNEDDTPIEYVQKMAREKAQQIAETHPDEIVIGCDTIVALGHKILGKPVSREDGFNMLSELSGKTHDVYTSVILLKNKQELEKTVLAKVEFYPLTEHDINHYLETNEYVDKAGAYGIQGQGALFVKQIEGDYYSIMGLPIATLYRMLQKFQESN